MATIRETHIERFNHNGALKTDVTGRVLMRREYVVHGVRYGRATEIGRFNAREDAEVCAREQDRREAAVKAKHLSGWVGCDCPDCQRPSAR